MSRLDKFLAGLLATYGTQVLTLLIGILITPKLVGLLGAGVYGKWLILGQGLVWLGLLDLGVVAILPRDIAAASCRGQAAKTLRTTLWIVFLQLPVIILAVSAGVWWATTKDSSLLFPALLVALGFVLSFPFRILSGFLQGKQDLAFLAAMQFSTWLLLTLSSLMLAMAGYGLESLAWGWLLGQVFSSAIYFFRWRSRFASSQPYSWAWPGFSHIAKRMRTSVWSSLRQISQLLMNGADLMVLGAIAGPELVVAYSCTAKLYSMGMNYPYSIAVTASPVLSEAIHRGPEAQARLGGSVSLLIMLLSGMIGLLILAVNEIFVGLWMGPKFYTGFASTLGLVAAMMTRHYLFGFGQILFSRGRWDGAVALAALLDGSLTVGAMILLCSRMGPAGIPLGSLAGVLLGTLPVTIYCFQRDPVARRMADIKEMRNWFAGFILAALPLIWTNMSGGIFPGFSSLWVALPCLLAYAWLVWTLLHREPLNQFTNRLVLRLRPTAH